MRYAAMSLALAVFFVSVADAQDAKKKDAGKEKDPKMFSMEMMDFQGRSFKEWQKDIKDKDPTRREIGIKNVLQFGPDKAYDAVPDIIAELKKHSNTKRIDLSVCVTGTMVLSTIFKYKKDPDPKDVKAAAGIYKTFLKDEQMMLRIRAVQGLPYLGPTSRDALTEVLLMAKEPSTWEARKEAVQTLGFIGFKDAGKPDIPVLGEVFKALNDPSSQVRIAAIRSSASLAMKAEPPTKAQVFAKFKSAIEADPDRHVVLTAHMAHMTLEGKVTPIHLTPMVKMLKHDNPEVRIDALQYIGAIGKDAKTAIPGLIECTDDPEATVAVNAIVVLASVDPDNSPSVFARIKDNTKYPEAVRVAAADAIAYQDKMAKDKKKAEKK